MGAWRGSWRLIDLQLFNILKSKAVRSVFALIFTVGALTVLSASLGGPGHDQLRSSSTQLRASLVPIWSWGTGTLSHAPGDRWDIGVRDHLGAEPEFTLDPQTGVKYPPDINPLRLNGYRRANATFVSLVRNEELVSMMASMRGVEDRVNRKLGYPWVFLNDQPFSDEFKRQVSSMTRSKVYFGLIPREHWSYPSYINQTKAADTRRRMEEEKVIYGGSESYRHMCRYNSGFFFRHPLLLQFDYYWRVEPGVEFYCDVDYDPFLLMQENQKSYGFTITLYEFSKTIETLWEVTQEFARLHPQYLHPQSALAFIVKDPRAGVEGVYNLCHFWSNFEIGDLRFWRSEAYQAYFDFLDHKGGFYYERWGDAPVHSIAAALFLPAKAIHQFDDIAYRHAPFVHCPANLSRFHTNGKCFCDPGQSFDTDSYSCMKQWWKVGGKPRP